MHQNDLRWRKFYDGWAPRYDLSIRLWSLLWGFSDAAERRKMVGRLGLRPGQRVLEVSVGTGRNLPFVAEKIGGDGRIVGLDISRGMLAQCAKKLARRRLGVGLLEGEGAHLPFPDSSFDAVLHFGGINEFDEKQRAIEEMMRVAKPGAKVVIGDEGLRPDARPSLRRRLLMKINRLYVHKPPLECLSPDVRDMHIDWFRGDACYLIDFAKP